MLAANPRRKSSPPLSKRLIRAVDKIENLSRVMKKRKTIRERLSAQKLPISAAGEIYNVLDKRMERSNAAIKGAAVGLGVGVGTVASSGYAVLEFGASKNLLYTAFATPIFTAIGAGVALKQKRGLVKQATTEFARILKLEIRTRNPDAKIVVDFLKKHKYIFIDKYGRLAGTSVPNVFGIGRIRIKSSDILG